MHICLELDPRAWDNGIADHTVLVSQAAYYQVEDDGRLHVSVPVPADEEAWPERVQVRVKALVTAAADAGYRDFRVYVCDKE